jgi:predicted GIY-YIG superfamily endonuclease
MENNYCLYWIHYPDQKEPMREGYIGITSDFNKRIKTHSKYTKYSHIKNRINSGAVATILFENLTKEQAENLELMHRPEENIGWNIAKGGNIPPSRKGKVSAGVLSIGDDRSEFQKQASTNHSKIMSGRAAPNRKSVKLFEQTFVSIKEACEKLEISKSQYYKYIEYEKVGIVFSNPQELKKHIMVEKNKKISETRISRGFHYNQYTK